jgi:hypothetical protein
MTRFLQRGRAFWGSAHAQDIAEYAVMLAVILLLVIGTVKLMTSKPNAGHATSHSPAGATK